MEYIYLFLLSISCISYIHTQKFTEESPYMLIRLMDIKLYQWKPGMLDQLEEALDDELKYIDEKKGIACKKIDFEQEAGYPKEVDIRFMDLSILGLCTDDSGKVHNIDKGLMTVAIERRIAEVNRLIPATIFSVGNVQFYKRDRNFLNLIIIPISVGIVLILIIMTFVLRKYRYSQKRRHIIDELKKKKGSGAKKAQTTANPDPHAKENQRLLELDPTVVGSASDTLGSPKEFTNEKYSSPPRDNPSGSGYNREHQGAPPPLPSKENRPPYYNRDEESSFQTQRPLRSSRERMHVPYENEPRFSPTQSQYPYDPRHPDMIPMHEKQPRVVIRDFQGDENRPHYYQHEDEQPSSSTFVPIPVQVERTGPHQRYVSPPYHSDPYYRHGNS